MATHKCRSKTNAKKYAHKMRKKGLKASIGKGKGKGWNVYTSR